MTEPVAKQPMREAADFELDEQISRHLRTMLPRVGEETVAAIIVEVPGYAGALSGQMGANIQSAVQVALGGFLTLAERSRSSDPGTPLEPALDAAYALGRGEARSGRSMDALLAAYRVGARVAWRELSGAALTAGLNAGTLAKFAELVFAYIDELSAASVTGHADELATTGRVRDRYLDRLARALVSGADADALVARAGRADWEPPQTLTAVLLSGSHLRSALAVLDDRALQVTEELPGLDDSDERVLLLVPDAGGRGRAGLLRVLQGRNAIVGPTVAWAGVRSSYLRVVAATRLLVPESQDAVDTEQHLVDLLVAADADAVRDLRARVLAPLAGLRPATAQRLEETLRSWLLHLGRRDDVAADLFVHAQTVRYRMGQIRELFGDRLDDPRTVLELTVALHRPLERP